MQSLPLGVLHGVFRCLLDPSKTINASLNDPKDALVSCSLVSTSWRSACLPFLWHFVDLTDPRTTSCEIEFFLQQSRELAELHAGHSVLNSFRQTYDYAKFVRGVVIDVSSLCLAHEATAAHKQKSESILAILDMIPPVQRLQLEFNHGGGIKLDGIDMAGMFAAILKKCEMLQHFTLSARGQMSEHLHPFLVAFTQQLTYPLSRIEIYGDIYLNFPAVFQTPAVRSISLNTHMDTMVLDGLAAFIWRWPNLRQMMISNKGAARHRFDSIIKTLADYCSCLEVLAIEGVQDDTVTDEHLCRLVDACPNLSDLSLSVTLPQVTDTFLNHCAFGAAKLRRLYLPFVPAITGRGIKEVPAWQSLQILDVGHHQWIDPTFVGAVIASCPKLAIYHIGGYSP